MTQASTAADTVYGVGEIEMALRRAGRGDVLGVSAAHQGRSWGLQPFMMDTAETVARGLPDDAWQCLSVGEGTKGPRLHDWAYLRLAHLGTDECWRACDRLRRSRCPRWSLRRARDARC